jgi:hypothetical protein
LHLNAFDALGRAKRTKKSIKEQIRDAKAITDLPLDPKLYPKIQFSTRGEKLGQWVNYTTLYTSPAVRPSAGTLSTTSQKVP